MLRTLLATLLIATAVYAQTVPDTLFSGLKWRLIGPYRGGRAEAVTGVPGEPNVYYFGAVAGGVWKSTDGGGNWTPIFDKQSASSIGAIAVAESDPNVIYVGTGEGCIRGNLTSGDGVYKSTDGGRSWRNVGLKDSRQIGAVIVDPRTPNVVLVAALGHVYGPNAERGVFRTTDGGASWQKVLFKNDHTGAIDVVFDPHNPNIVFASLWEVSRTPWSLNSGGEGSGLYKSTDGGATWTQLKNGIPKGPLGRIGVSVSGADGDRVYALIEAVEGGIFRSDDQGESWTKVNDDERYRQRAWYFTHIFADPKSADTVYVLNTGAFRSTDGGKSFSLLPAPHGDHHALWIDPTNPQRMINGNDGGVDITTDGGKTWTNQYNQPTAQFYHVVADNDWPYRLYGSQQDNSSVAIATRTDYGTIDRQDWYPVGGGESGSIAPDPTDSDIVYAGDNGGVLTRFDKKTQQALFINPWPLDTSGRGANELEHRFQWTEPTLVSPHDHNTLYTCAERVFKSTDGGHSWTAISPDLTRNDKSKQQPSGGPITLDITSVEYYDTVFALAESPFDGNGAQANGAPTNGAPANGAPANGAPANGAPASAGGSPANGGPAKAGAPSGGAPSGGAPSFIAGGGLILWAGTDDGLVQLTRDGGKTWTNVTPKDMPEWSTISQVDASPLDAGSAWIAVDRHRLDDVRPYLWKTSDFGKTWTSLTNGIPNGAFVRAVRQDPKRKDLVYAATEGGVYVSFDGAQHWQPLQLNLPATPVTDLIIKGDDIAISTNGRGFWVLDSIAPLREASSQIANGDMHLYTPSATVRFRYPEALEQHRPVGVSPMGSYIDYWFKTAPTGEVTLDIKDSKGNLVRHYSSQKKKVAFEQPPEWPDLVKPPELIPAEAGMNRFAWNQRYESPTETPQLFYAGNGPEGPIVMPGTYHLTLTANGHSESADLVVVSDPRVKISNADLQAAFDLQMRVRDDFTKLHETLNQMRTLRGNLDDAKRKVGEKSPLIATIDKFETDMAPIEAQLTQVKLKSSEGTLRYPVMLNEQYDTFRQMIENADAVPTQPMLDVYTDLHQRLNTAVNQWNALLKSEGASLTQTNVPLVVISQ